MTRRAFTTRQRYRTTNIGPLGIGARPLPIPFRGFILLACKKKIRLVHTSDVHLGDAAGHTTAYEAFRAVVGTIPRLGGDLLLLVEDIFDNARISDGVVELFLNQVGRLSVPAVVLPGNHDLHDDGSVY